MSFAVPYRQLLQLRAPEEMPTEESSRRAVMSRVSTYLNFMGTTEEAFSFYSSVFGTEITGEIARVGDMPSGPGAPELSDAERKMVAHVELPILAGHVLMGTDMLASMGHELRSWKQRDDLP